MYCNNSDLDIVLELNKYPITLSPPTNIYSSDQYTDLHFMSCKSCGIVQLRELVPLNILYQEYHNDTTNSKMWQGHHDMFANFIKKYNTSKKVLEIGGYTGVLSKRLLSKEAFEYSVLDLCEKKPNLDGVDFINGDCEVFDYSSFPTVIASHVFEHLYNPHKFLKQLAESNVQDIFISIPNMNYLLQTNNSCILNVEHTFYCDDQDIKNMFILYKYKCIEQYNYNTHSYFFYFKKVQEPLEKYKINTDERLKQIIYALHKIHIDYQNCILPAKCFIAPAGVLGQKAYYYLRNQDEKILGFLDNDPYKIGKRVYGTLKNVYNPSILESYKNQPISVFLVETPYKEEIKQQYLKINPSICFI